MTATDDAMAAMHRAREGTTHTKRLCGAALVRQGKGG